MRAHRRNPWYDALMLSMLSVFVYTAGLTTHGLTNWQEARRAVVGREMYVNNEWIVPTYFGEPYIAKPPMIYWVQMLIGRARASLGYPAFSDESELRLAVALGGVMGVLATYFASRRMLKDRHDPRLGNDAAILASLGLASGILYFRSSRIGELDVLTVPFVVTAIAAAHHAQRVWRDERRNSWGAVVLSSIAAIGAALTKGPPALLVIVLAGYLPALIEQLRAPRASGVDGRRSRIIAASIGAIALAFAGGLMAPRINFPLDWFGLVFFGVVGGVLAAGVSGLYDAVRRGNDSIKAAHVLIILGLPVLAVWIWGRLVAYRIGADAVAALANAEVEDNLRVLVLDSPAKNIGFMLYGLAPIALAMVAGFAWFIRERPALTREQRVPFTWCAAGLIAFSMLGKGVARYLTPVWPGVAMVGGLWLAYTLREEGRKRGHERLRLAVLLVLVLSALAQAWWYGIGREIHYGDRSPRSFIRELLPHDPGATAAVWKLDEPALDYYAGRRLERYDDSAALLASVEESGPLIIVGREKQAGEWTGRVLGAGLSVRAIEVRANYRWRADGERITAWRISR